ARRQGLLDQVAGGSEGDQSAAVRRNRKQLHRAGRTLKRPRLIQRLALEAPEAGGGVVAAGAGSELLAVGEEGDALERVRKAFGGLKQLAARHIPQPERAVGELVAAVLDDDLALVVEKVGAGGT